MYGKNRDHVFAIEEGKDYPLSSVSDGHAPFSPRGGLSLEDRFETIRIGHLTRNIQCTIPDAQLAETPLPLCPQLKLHLISPENMRRPFTDDEIRAILANTPYWVFCWASGQALAYYILQNESLIEGKCVLDFGSGSGVAAIAAAMAGASKVIACDMDGDAIDAITANAALNNVRIHTCESLEEVSDRLDIILAADVLYDLENHCYLEEFLNLAQEILVADSRLEKIDLYPYKKLTEIFTATLPDLEDCDEFKRVSIYRAQKASPRSAPNASP